MEDWYHRIFADKEKVMVVFAHPDDMEIFCGGTVARLIDEGKSVRAVCVTKGNRGTHKHNFSPLEFEATRLESYLRGAVALGLTKEDIFNLGIDDGAVEDTLENIGKIVRHIREFRPNIIITHEPSAFVHSFTSEPHGEYSWINHRDHRKTAGLVFDAIYPYSRDHAFFPEQIRDGLLGHEVHEVLFSDAYLHPSVVSIEVSKYLDKKRLALECHRTGGVLSDAEIEGFMTEGAQENGWFEILGWFKGFH